MTTTIAPTSPTATAATGAGSSGKALGSLAGNFNDFLKLLMVQLQNQDPSSPMDTNQFTSQLVQYSSVEQQINMNSNLTKLLGATQDGALLQGSSMVGQDVALSGDMVPLQGGSARVRFTAAKAGLVNIDVQNEAGTTVRRVEVAAQAGANEFTWDGMDQTGRGKPDGAYHVAVHGADGAPLAVEPHGRVTGVQRSGGALTVMLGLASVKLSEVQSVAR